MKHILLFPAICFSFSYLSAQNELNGKTLTQYLFPEFTEGTVLQKSGEINKANLNYNTLTQEMIFEQNNQRLALDKIQNIDTVFIKNRKFVPVNEAFYEVACNAPVALLIQTTTTVIPPGNETGFGKSQTSAITNVSDLKSSGRAYELKLPDDFKLLSKTNFWLKKDERYISIKNIKDVRNVFAEKAAAINIYLKANEVSFKKKDEVIKLIEFCNKN